MKKLLPEPVIFAGSMIFLAIAAVAFALLSPEVRLWLQNQPVGPTTAVGAFAGSVIGLFAIAAAIAYRAHARQKTLPAPDLDEEPRRDEARILAAAMHGEFVALGQWLSTQADAAAQHGRNDFFRSNEAEDGIDFAGFSTRPVFEANAARLDILGPDLAAAVAYCHTIFEQAEWQHNAALSAGRANGADTLRDVEAKLRVTAGYLAAFAENGPGQIDSTGREALFANTEGQTES